MVARAILSFALIGLYSSCVYSVIEIADVEASQIEGESKVLIIYDLGNSDSVPTMVTMEYTLNGEYWVESSFVTGDVGDSVSQGFNKRMIWDAGSELPNTLYPSVRVRVRIDDGIPGEPPVPPSGFSYIPASSFGMGSPESERVIVRTSSEPIDPSDETLHQAILTRGFFIGQTEVSFAEWTAVRNWGLENGYEDLPVGQSGGPDPGGQPNPSTHPLTLVSWFDVIKWLNAKSERDRLVPCYTINGAIYREGEANPKCDFEASGYRLPTESEWEYACRAGSPEAFYTGPIQEPDSVPLDPNLDQAGWYQGNSGNDTRAVGDPSKAENDFGLRDMHGNVVEWCWDWYGPYAAPEMIDPTGPSSGELRVARGGAFSSLAAQCRSAYRSKLTPSLTSDSVGFRIVRTVID